MKELKIAVQDCIIRSLPELYGLILYARPKDEFMITVERCTQKSIFSLIEPVDLESDRFGWNNRYDFILSFNVLEKLMNPLHYLTRVRKSLRADGKLILTTAIDWKFTGTKYNFIEYDKVRLIAILNKAELKISKMTKLRVLWWRINSWKWLLGQFWYVEAHK